MPDISRTEHCFIAASSHLPESPPAMAADGDLKTTWRSALTDTSPSIEFDWTTGGFDSVLYSIGEEFEEHTEEASSPGGTPFVIADQTTNWLYIGRSNRFGEVMIDLASFQSGGGTTTRFEYYNGTWVELPNVVDGTWVDTVPPRPFGQDGVISFPIRSDWEETNVNEVGPFYWIRWRATNNCSSAPTAYQLIPTDGGDRDFRGRTVRVRFSTDGGAGLPTGISINKTLGASGWTDVDCETFEVAEETTIHFDSGDEEFDRLRISFTGGPVAVRSLQIYAYESPLIRGNETVEVLERKIDALPEPAQWRVGVDLFAGEDGALGSAEDGNLCRDIIPTVDSEHEEETLYEASFSTDGDPDTYWLSDFSDWQNFIPSDRTGGNGPWWSIDLGNTYRIYRIAASWILWENIPHEGLVDVSWYDDLASGFGSRVYVSSDGQTWHLIVDECVNGGGRLIHDPCEGTYGPSYLVGAFNAIARYVRIVPCSVPTLLEDAEADLFYMGLSEAWISAWKIEPIENGGGERLVDLRPFGGRIEVDRSETRVHDTSLTFLNADGQLSPGNPDGLLLEEYAGLPVRVHCSLDSVGKYARDVGWGLLEHVTERHDRGPLSTLHLSDPRGSLHDVPLKANGLFVWDRDENGVPSLVSSLRETNATGDPLGKPLLDKTPFVNPYVCLPQEWRIVFVDSDGNFEATSVRSGVRKTGSISDDPWLSGPSECTSEVILPHEVWNSSANPAEGDEITFLTTYSFGYPVDDRDGLPIGHLLQRLLCSVHGAHVSYSELAGEYTPSGIYREFVSTFVDLSEQFPMALCAGAFTEPLTVLETVAWLAQGVLACVFIRSDGKFDVSSLWPGGNDPAQLPRLLGDRDLTRVRSESVARQTAFRINYDYDWETCGFRRGITIPVGATPSTMEIIDTPFFPATAEGHVTTVCGRAYGWYRNGLQVLECEALPHADGTQLGDVLFISSESPAIRGDDMEDGVVAQVVDMRLRPVHERGGSTCSIPGVSLSAVDRTFLMRRYYTIDVDPVPSGGDSKPIW